MKHSANDCVRKLPWSRVQLEALTHRITKGTTPTTVGGRFVDQGINFLKVESITEDGSLDHDKLAYIDEASDEMLRRSRLQGGDVLFSIAGAIGRTYLVKNDDLPANINQALAIVRFDADKLCPRYGYYAMRDRGFQGEALGRVVQCAQANVNLTQLAKSVIAVPALAKQSRIASILSAYDDLIENNRRRMRLLEESARQLYREWFVRLRFPGHERAKITNGLPEGWEKKPLENLTGFLKRGISPHYDDDAEGLVINQKCIRDGRFNLNLARHQSREFASERQVQVGDVLVNSTGEGTLGRVAQVTVPVANCTVDTHVTIVRPIPDFPIYYFGMAVLAWEPQFTNMGRGATNQTELSPAAIGECAIVVPCRALLDEFESFAAPISRQVSVLTAQNDKLRAARDLLLPKLMSGDILA